MKIKSDVNYILFIFQTNNVFAVLSSLHHNEMCYMLTQTHIIWTVIKYQSKKQLKDQRGTAIMNVSIHHFSCLLSFSTTRLPDLMRRIVAVVQTVISASGNPRMTSGYGVCVGHILIIRFNAFLGDAHAADRLAGGGIAHQVEGRVSGEGNGRIGAAIVSVLNKTKRHLSNKAYLSGSS